MPDLTTHILFAEQIIDKLEPSLSALIKRHPSVFFVGTQGPDLLFFRKARPGINPVPYYASLLHKKKTDEVLLFCRDYAAACSDRAEYALLLPYVMGFYCHYFLDRTVHPYVYYLTDMRCGNGYSSNPSAVHAQIEAEIDSIFYRLFRGRPITEFRPKDYMQVGYGAKTVIAKFYTEMLSSVFQLSVPIRQIIHCFDDILFLSSFLYGNGRIAKLTGGLLKHAGRVADVVPAHIKKDHIEEDTANFCENTWYYPADRTRHSNRSVLSLYQSALGEAADSINRTFQNPIQSGTLCFDTSLNFSGVPHLES